MLTFGIKLKGVWGGTGPLRSVFFDIAKLVTFLKKIGFILAKIVKIVIYRAKWIKNIFPENTYKIVQKSVVFLPK